MQQALIVTIFTVPNFGSVLQTYATQCVVEQFGYKCRVLNYDHNRGEWAKGHGVPEMSFKSKVGNWLGLKAKHRKAKLLKKFVKSHIHLTSPYSTLKDGKYIEIFRKELSKFSALSVREAHGREILSQLGLRNSQLVLDPTLLLSANQWDVLRKKSLKSEKYILLYLLRYAFEPCPYIYDVLKYYQDKLQCKIIALEGYEGHDPYVKNLKIEDATESTISEFLDYFAQASLVVTSSFHGTAFALNYGVPLLSITPTNGDDRQSSLLEQVKLNQCRLRVNEEITHANPFYDKEQEQINLGKLRKESLDWIEANL